MKDWNISKFLRRNIEKIIEFDGDLGIIYIDSNLH